MEQKTAQQQQQQQQFIVYLEPRGQFHDILHRFMQESALVARNSAHDYEMIHCTLTSFFSISNVDGSSDGRGDGGNDNGEINVDRATQAYVKAIESAVSQVRSETTEGTSCCSLTRFQFKQLPYTMKFMFESQWLVRCVQLFTETVNKLRMDHDAEPEISTDKTRKLHISLAYGEQYRNNMELLREMLDRMVLNQTTFTDLLSRMEHQEEMWRIVMYERRRRLESEPNIQSESSSSSFTWREIVSIDLPIRILVDNEAN